MIAGKDADGSEYRERASRAGAIENRSGVDDRARVLMRLIMLLPAQIAIAGGMISTCFTRTFSTRSTNVRFRGDYVAKLSLRRLLSRDSVF
jgi:hypothetical protein